MNSRDLLEDLLDDARDLARLEIARALIAPHRKEELRELDEIVADFADASDLNPNYGRF